MQLTSLRSFRALALSVGLAALVAISYADTITSMTVGVDGTVSFDGSQRKASLKSGIDGYAVGDVTGTPGAADVAGLFGGIWTKEGELTGNGTNDWLTVNLTSGSWGGNNDITGTFAINSSFWSTYGSAVISMHVGNGAGNPDWFLWEITPNTLTGTFSYDRVAGGGGGLSNLFLWGSGAPATVPDSTSSMWMLGLSFAALAVFRRRKA